MWRQRVNPLQTSHDLYSENKTYKLIFDTPMAQFGEKKKLGWYTVYVITKIELCSVDHLISNNYGGTPITRTQITVTPC